jgi:cytidine deaminase
MTGMGQKGFKVDEGTWDQLAKAAWEVRENAHLVETGKTKVGAAVLCPNGQIYAGCNVQHPFKSHIHAEISAIASMVAAGERRFIAILIVSDYKHFTPCGDCRDWIMEIGGPQVAVGAQWEPNGCSRETWSAAELLPYPPSRQ